MGALHVNGQKATGVNITLADGVFIDTDNVIEAITINAGSTAYSEYSYTAIQDCYINWQISSVASEPVPRIYLNDEPIYMSQVNSSIFRDGCMVKKGQVLKFTGLGVYAGFTVYGIQQGSTAPYQVNYSTDEQVIGTWIDGSTLYERTIELSSTVATTANNWTTISGVTITDEDVIVKTEVYLGADKTMASAGFGKVDNGVFEYFNTIRLAIDKIVIQYTKSS